MELREINLLNLMKTFDIGGVEKSTIIYANELSELINKINIMAFKGSYNYKDMINPKVRTYFFPYIVNHNPITFCINVKLVLKVIRVQKINCINYHQRIFLPYILFVKVFCRKIKIIYTGHNVFNDFINKLLIADKFIAVSLAVKNDFITAKKKSVHLIYHGIKQKVINPGDRNKTILNFGYVGRFVRIKGIMTMLKAFKLFHEKYSEHKLFMVGSGVLTNEMNKFIDENYLEDSIKIIPPQSEIENIFNQIDILVFPSEYVEGFGLVILEAMANNIAIIKSHFINDEKIFNNENCFLFEPANINDLLNKMEGSIIDKNKREILINNSQLLIQNKFNFERAINEYLDLLRGL